MKTIRVQVVLLVCGVLLLAAGVVAAAPIEEPLSLPSGGEPPPEPARPPASPDFSTGRDAAHATFWENRFVAPSVPFPDGIPSARPGLQAGALSVAQEASEFDPQTVDAPQLSQLTPQTDYLTCPAGYSHVAPIWDGDFEEDWYWYFNAFGETEPPEPGYDPTVAYSGTRSVVITGTDLAEFWVWQFIEFPSRFEQSLLSFQLRRSSTDPEDRLFVVFYDDWGMDILAWATVSYTVPAGQWQLIQLPFSDSVRASLAGRPSIVKFMAFTDDVNPTLFYLDDVALELCAPIPPCQDTLENGDFESYLGPFYAWNSDGNVSWGYNPEFRDVYATIGGSSQYLDNGGFEAAQFDPWFTSGSPELDYSTSYEGFISALLGGYDSANDQIWQVIDIPTDTTSMALDFWYALQTDETLAGYDTFCVMVWDPAGSPVYAYECLDFGVTGDQPWTYYSFDLTPYLATMPQRVHVGFVLTTDGGSPSAAWVDGAALRVTTSRESWLWQPFTFPAAGRTGYIEFWLGAAQNVDPADEFRVILYDSVFNVLGWWWPTYTPGEWKKVKLAFVANPAWLGQDLSLAFWLNGNASPSSIFGVEEVRLNVCPEAPYLVNPPLGGPADFLRADIHITDGTLALGTTRGDPDTANDDDKALLFGFTPGGYSTPWSSFTTLRIVSPTGTIDVALDEVEPIRPPYLDGETIVTRWWIQGIEVAQVVDLVENPFTRRQDTALIQYELVNRNFEVHSVGLRTMLDVKIGDNDGAPYFVPGYGPVIHEVEFPNARLSGLPPFWKAFEGSLADPFDPAYLKGQGTLAGGAASPPNRFVIGRWPELYRPKLGVEPRQLWDYAIDPGAVITADSAVALYWNPVSLYNGEAANFATYYGLGGGGGGETWIDAPLDVSCEQLEFELVLWVNNRGSTALAGGSSTLVLPPGGTLRLAHGVNATQARADILPGETQPLSWLLAASGDVTDTLVISAATTFSGAPTLWPQPHTVHLPRCVRPINPPTNLVADDGTRSIELSWDPSTSEKVTGYNVYRSTSTSGPFARLNTAAVVGTFYEDEDPSLVTGTLYYYQVTTLAGASESAPSNVANASFGQLKLFIPDAYSPNGAVVTVPVNIANANGLRIYGQQVWLSYPANLLQPLWVTRTILTLDGYAFRAVSETGRIRIDLLEQEGRPALYGNGTLFHVYFQVIGTAGFTGALQLDRARSEIFPVESPLTPLPLVHTDGSFQVRKNYIMGDLNGDSKVTAVDAELALAIAVGKLSPTKEQKAAGDVNGDGRINSADAALISRMARGMAALPAGQGRAQAVRGRMIAFSMPSTSSEQGGTFKVPISLSDAEGVAGADMMLNYDPTVLEALGANLGSLTSGQNFVFETKLDVPGVVKLSLAQQQGGTNQGLPAGSSGVLIEVEFRIKQSAQDGVTTLTLSKASLSDPYSRDFETSVLQITVDTGSGQVTIGAGPTLDKHVYLPVVLKNK
ncbi:MAG: fibronectin type III domain-containing protein [Thermoflexales bacterium]|nr:fibronectin type III domain-containing protein [Thermoflexales bacterium]